MTHHLPNREFRMFYFCHSDFHLGVPEALGLRQSGIL